MLAVSGKAPRYAGTNRAEWCLAFPHLEQGHDRHPMTSIQAAIFCCTISCASKISTKSSAPWLGCTCLANCLYFCCSPPSHRFPCIRVSFKDPIHCPSPRASRNGSAATGGGGELFAGSSAMMMQSSSSTGSISFHKKKTGWYRVETIWPRAQSYQKSIQHQTTHIYPSDAFPLKPLHHGARSSPSRTMETCPPWHSQTPSTGSIKRRRATSNLTPKSMVKFWTTYVTSCFPIKSYQYMGGSVVMGVPPFQETSIL